MSKEVAVINVERSNGEKQVVTATVGQSLMEALRTAGIDQILAICGGCCSCATCHVYIDDSFREKLPSLGASEDDLLDSSNHRTAQSRLSCQIRLTEDISGIAESRAARVTGDHTEKVSIWVLISIWVRWGTGLTLPSVRI
jgi:2Fe-2S ferredoxin